MRALVLIFLLAIVGTLKISNKGIKFIKEVEKLELNAVFKNGKWRIGYGTTNDDYRFTKKRIVKGLKIDKTTAEKWLKKTITNKYTPLVNKYSEYKWTQNEFDALISFAHGGGDLRNLTANGRRSKSDIAKNILNFNSTLNGKVTDELVNRRKAEQRLFLTKPSS